MNELIIGTFCIGIVAGGAIMWGIDWQLIKRREKANGEFVESVTEHYKNRVFNLEKEMSRLIEERDVYRARVRDALDALSEKHDR